jgi:hypothetical protein
MDDMMLSEDTQKIMGLVEQTTGKPVYLQPDPALPSLATVKAARGDAPAHLVTYKPNAQGVDYALASQFGTLLRIYETPAEARHDLVTKADGRASVRQSL